MTIARRTLLTGIGGTIAGGSTARAQPPVPVVGLLGTGARDDRTKSFLQGLASRGFEEGRTLALVDRSAEGNFDRLPGLAAELVKLKVSAIFASGGPQPAQAAKAATTAIPIVFAYGGDPVADGLVASFNRPGRNVTGATFMGVSLTSKRMELLKHLLPQAVDVALMLNPKSTLTKPQIRDATAAAPALGLRLHVIDATGPEQIDAAFAEMDRRKIAAVLVGVDPSYGLVFRDRILALAARYRIPAVYDSRHYVEPGGLISYGTILADAWRQAGVYTGRILKGEKPQDLPVVQTDTYETVINLKTAKALGLEVPPGVLAIADDTIE